VTGPREDSAAANSEGELAGTRDLVIVGGGAAGLTCAIYAGRGRLRTLLLEKMLPGGQVALSHVIENYPGFPEGIAGLDLAQQMHQHAARFGARIETGTVTAIEADERPFQLRVEGEGPAGGPRARCVLIATGCSPRKLGAPGEKELSGRGVSYCATCDGPLYGDKPVLVVGGGNAAIDDALFLANVASKVTVVHRRDQLRADPILQERALANPKIEFLWSHVVTEIVGEGSVEAARTRHVATGEETAVPAAGVFIAIGETPQTGFLPEAVTRDKDGYVVTDSDLETSVPGIFAAGDVRAGAYRQIAAAVGEGVVAYRSIRHQLEGQQ
jgi:thioredoxin reductase (NADPH)